VRNVWFPSYGLPTLDSAAAEVYDSLGYTPKPVSGFEALVRFSGALRCLALVGMRGPYDERGGGFMPV